MKNARSTALNAAFIAMIVSSIIALICWLLNRPFTSSEYQIPFGYENGKYQFFTIPKIGIEWFPVIVTLITFQLVYLKQLATLSENNFIGGIVTGTFFGVFIGTVFGTLLGTPVGIIVGTFFGIFIGILGVFLENNMGTVLGTCFGSVLGPINVFFFILFHTSLGVGEAVGYTVIAFGLLLIVNLVGNAVLPIILAIAERLWLIIKTIRAICVKLSAIATAKQVTD